MSAEVGHGNRTAAARRDESIAAGRGEPVAARRSDRIAALGAGRMGRGIAIAFAYAGHEVRLVDVKPRTAEAVEALRAQALAEIDASLAAMSRWGAFDDTLRPQVLRRVRFFAREAAAEALADADFVFEGVPEVLDAKREAFAFACEHLRPEATIASTTSTFLVGQLAGFVAHPQRFLNAHWLNPAYVVPLVELSAHEGTSAQALQSLRALLESIGKVPVVCAAAPGYIVPRLQSLIMNEAARMIEQGVASAEDIDRATRYGLGFRFANIGVVEFIDYGGNDILYYASRYLAQALGDERYASPAIVDRHMREGRNGLRDGKGFYDFDGVDLTRYRSETLGRMLGMLSYVGLLRTPAADESDRPAPAPASSTPTQTPTSTGGAT